MDSVYTKGPSPTKSMHVPSMRGAKCCLEPSPLVFRLKYFNSVACRNFVLQSIHYKRVADKVFITKELRWIELKGRAGDLSRTFISLYFYFNGSSRTSRTQLWGAISFVMCEIEIRGLDSLTWKTGRFTDLLFG
jgi:hypothetical protein